MARKTKLITIEDEGRDKGKVFKLIERSAYDAEKWALRLIEAGAKAGVSVVGVAGGGVAALQAMGLEIFASISSIEREPLLDQLFESITIVRDPRHPEMSFPLINTGDEQDIEEIKTLGLLQYEVIMLHGNFSSPAEPLKPTSDSPKSTTTNTKTSRPSSARPSPRKPPRL